MTLAYVLDFVAGHTYEQILDCRGKPTGFLICNQVHDGEMCQRTLQESWGYA